jgi:hypothetical protein
LKKSIATNRVVAKLRIEVSQAREILERVANSNRSSAATKTTRTLVEPNTYHGNRFARAAGATKNDVR